MIYYSNGIKYYMKGMKRDSKKLETHLVCWTIYISYEILVAGVMNGRFSSIYYYCLFYFLNIGLFYLHANIAMPKIINQSNNFKRFSLLTATVVLEMAAYLLLTIVFSQLLDILHIRKSTFELNWRFFAGSSWRGILFLLAGTGYYSMMSHIRRNKELMEKRIEMERLKSDLVSLQSDFLRSQINPHLLFNTLNFVRYAAKQKPKDSEDAILRLSEIMSYAMEKDIDGYVPIEREIRQAQNIIQLNNLRFGEKLQLEFIVDIHGKGVMIMPIILLTLIENIFKHGSLLLPTHPARIVVRSDSQGLSILTSNRPKRTRLKELESYGSGLKNIELRLNSFLPARHHFYYGMENDSFVVRLNIAN